ncbi:MAG: PAS domain S-box protein [Acidimicrobiia bacterium]
MIEHGRPPPGEIFGAVVTPLPLEVSTIHRVRLNAASVATVVFVGFALAWDWTAGWVAAGLAAYAVFHAALHLRRNRPVWMTLLTDIIVVSIAIAIIRPPALVIITPVVYLVAAPMLLTAGRVAIGLALTAIATLSAATYVSFEPPQGFEWTAFRTLLMACSFLLIFGPLILSMIHATSEETRRREGIRSDLDAARDRLEKVFRTAPVGMELTGVGPSDFLAVNSAFCEFLGYSEEELLVMSIIDVVHPVDLAASHEEATRVVAGELDRFEQERRYIHADGRVRWAHFSLSVVLDDNGAPVFAIGQIQDITRRKVAEAERDLLLDLSLAVAGAITPEEAMRSVLAGLCNAGGWSIGVLWVPRGGGMERVHLWAAYPGLDAWNDTVSRLGTGEGLVGAAAESRKPIDIHSIAEDARFLARDAAIALGLDTAMAVPVMVSDEVVGVLLFVGVPGVDPGAARATTGAAISQLGHAIAAKLAAGERDQLAGVLEHSTDLAAFSDIDGKIRYINSAGRTMLGLDPERDVTSLRVEDLHPPEVADHIVREVVPTVLAEGTWRGETIIRAMDGRLIPTSQVVLAHFDESGQVSYLSTVARDITAQKLLEAQQEEVIRSKDEFIASVSHELRTPLTAVRGFAEILHDQHANLGAAEHAEMIAAIASESADVSDIVEDLLVAARSDIDQLTIAVKPVPLDPVVRETSERVRWAHKSVTLEVDGDAVALADPLRLRQILRNLMGNAVRYGGDSIRVTARQVDGAVLIEVLDDGQGISEQFREEIFAPYRRAHDRAGLAGSVGLGLAVSRRLARLMGGDVAYSHDGTWSTFTLRLPVS